MTKTSLERLMNEFIKMLQGLILFGAVINGYFEEEIKNQKYRLN